MQAQKDELANRIRRALYSPETIENLLEKLGHPGGYPFTRGVHPEMYRSKIWTMRQYTGFGTAQDTNQRFKYMIKQGQTGLSVAFDLPTQMGYDPTHPPAYGEIGKAGVSISTLKDVEELFSEIPLDKITVSMTINATAHILLSLYVSLARSRGIKNNQLSGTIQNDTLKEFIARGCYIFDPEHSVKITTDVIEHCIKNLPEWNFISVSGYHIREAGSTAAQELGFTLANAIHYIECSLERGLDINDLGRRISFFFGVHNNFLEEIAKFRAARRLWARFMKERFHAKDPRAMMLRFHAQTCGSTLTSQQPENNIVRVTLQALAAILGGAQSLHTNAMDEALALPTDKSAKIALRTQQIIAFETDMTSIVDPFGGSYYLENLTDRLENEARLYIDKIFNMGGPQDAIKNGFYNSEIEKSALEFQREVETGKIAIVGVNKYIDPVPERYGVEPDNNKVRVQIHKVDDSIQKQRIREIEMVKKQRSNTNVTKALDKLKHNVQENKNIMESVIECVSSYVTLGEICDTLGELWGRCK